MTSSKIVFYFCLSFIAGIFAGSITFISQLILLGFLILAIFLISLFWNSKRAVLTGFCIIFLMLGVWRMERTQFKIKNNDFLKYNLYGKEVVLKGIVSKEPDIREKSAKLTINNIKIITGDKDISVSGKILITTGRYPRYNYGDLLKIKGKLEEPPVFEDFNYKDYLLKEGIFASIPFPVIELLRENLERGIFPQSYRGILWFKEKLRQSIFQNFSPPQSLILEGTILGDNSALTPELKNKLNITGLRHIIAISGTHVVILSSILMSFLLMLGFWRGQAIYLSLIFISLYIILTGLPASGIRAGIMGGILLLSQKFGRQNTSSRTIIIAGAIMLAQNPLLLLSDVGFQLSFLSSMGIIHLYPLLNEKLNSLTKRRFSELISIASATIASQIFTLPILVFNFGNISLISLPANLLVLPVVYWLMVFGFLAALFGIFSAFLGWIFALPCWILLTYFLKIIDFFSQNWAIKTIENIPWFWLVIFYLVLGFGVRYFNKRARLRFLNY